MDINSFIHIVKTSASNSYYRIISNTCFFPQSLVVSVDFVKETESVNEVNDKLQVEVEISGFRSRPVTVRSVKYLFLTSWFETKCFTIVVLNLFLDF